MMESDSSAILLVAANSFLRSMISWMKGLIQIRFSTVAMFSFSIASRTTASCDSSAGALGMATVGTAAGVDEGNSRAEEAEAPCSPSPPSS